MTGDAALMSLRQPMTPHEASLKQNSVLRIILYNTKITPLRKETEECITQLKFKRRYETAKTQCLGVLYKLITETTFKPSHSSRTMSGTETSDRGSSNEVATRTQTHVDKAGMSKIY